MSRRQFKECISTRHRDPQGRFNPGKWIWGISLTYSLTGLNLPLVPLRRLISKLSCLTDFPGGTRTKEPAWQCRRHKRRGFDPSVGKIPWRRAWQRTPVFLPGESHGQRSLAGHSSWGHKESDTTEPVSTCASFLIERTDICWLYSWKLDRSLLLFERL